MAKMSYDFDDLHDKMVNAFSGDVIAAYGGYQGSDWQYYLKVKKIKFENGLAVSVTDAPDVLMG